MKIKIISFLLTLILISCKNQVNQEIDDKINDLYHSHKIEEALTMLDSVYNKNGWTFDAYILKINILLTDKKFQEAQFLLNDLNNIESHKNLLDYNVIQHRYYYGLLFYMIEDFFNAEAYWNLCKQTIIDVMGKNDTTHKNTLYYAKVHLNLGLCFEKMERYNEAISYFDTAIFWYHKVNDNKKISESFYYKAHCFEYFNNIDSALILIDSAINHYENYNAYIKKGKLLQHKKNYHSAIIYYQNAIQFDEINYYAYYLLGLAYKDLNDYDNALENFDKAYFLEHKIEILIEKAKIYKENKDNQMYLNCMKDIIQLNPNNHYSQDFIRTYNLSKIYKINEGFVHNVDDLSL